MNPAATGVEGGTVRVNRAPEAVCVGELGGVLRLGPEPRARVEAGPRCALPGGDDRARRPDYRGARMREQRLGRSTGLRSNRRVRRTLGSGSSACRSCFCSPPTRRKRTPAPDFRRSCHRRSCACSKLATTSSKTNRSSSLTLSRAGYPRPARRCRRWPGSGSRPRSDQETPPLGDCERGLIGLGKATFGSKS